MVLADDDYIWYWQMIINGICRYDVDDSGSMDTKELGRLLFTLIDNGIRVIDDFVIDS